MHVIFVEPSFPSNQREFVRALKEVGARVTAIAEAPPSALDNEMRGWLDGHEQVPSVTNGEALLAAVRRVQERTWVDRLEATVEAHITPCAWVREQCEIPGTSTRTTFSTTLLTSTIFSTSTFTSRMTSTGTSLTTWTSRTTSTSLITCVIAVRARRGFNAERVLARCIRNIATPQELAERYFGAIGLAE